MMPIDKAAIITAYQNNESVSAIARSQQCSRTYVYWVVKKAGLQVNRHIQKKTKKQKIYDAIIKAGDELEISPYQLEALAYFAAAKIVTLPLT